IGVIVDREQNLLFADRETRAGDNGGRHERAEAGLVEQLSSASRQYRIGTTKRRDSPLGAPGIWKRPYVDVISPGFVRCVGQPAPVGREPWGGLEELGHLQRYSLGGFAGADRE